MSDIRPDPFYDNAVYLDEDPFVLGYDEYPLYLKPDCPLIGAGAGYIDEYPYLIGKTTGYYPDTNMVNIGFHYPNWDFSNAGDTTLSADLDNDMSVNFKDFALLADGWLTIYDFNSLITMAGQWLDTTTGYPPIALTISGDANNGFVEVGAAGFTSDTQRIFLLVDGQYVGKILWFRDGEPFRLDVSALGPGTHQLKAVGVDTEGNVTCSNLQENIFDCPLNYCYCFDAYESNEPHNFCAYYTGPSDISVKVYNEDGNLVWSQAYSAQNLNGVIPSEITSRDDLDLIVFEPSEGGGMAITKPLAIGFNPEKIDANIRALLILPDWLVNLLNDVDDAVRDALEFRDVNYYELKGSNASYENLSWFAHNRYIRYIYFAGHGGYGVDPDTGEEYFGEDIRRTVIGLADGWVVSAKNSDFPAGTAPPWCVPIKGERGYKSIYKLKRFLPGELKLVQLDTCFSGRLQLSSTQLIEVADPYDPGAIPESDMSWAFKMVGADTYGQFCQGWYDKKGVIWGQTNYETFGVLEWTNLKDGDNLYQALDDTLSDPCVAGKISSQHLRMSGKGLMTGVKIED